MRYCSPEQTIKNRWSAAQTFSLDEAGVDAARDARKGHLGGPGLLESFDGTPPLRLLKREKASVA
jgi:hypothetical protein